MSAPSTSAVHNFGASAGPDSVVYGASRPGETLEKGPHGYPDKPITEAEVREWAQYVKSQGVTRVVGLLEPGEISTYYEKPPVEVLESEGLKAVNVPLINPDSRPEGAAAALLPPEAFKAIESEFAAAEAAGEKVVTHCWGGVGRTGKVLAAWLVKSKGLSVEEAAQLVESTAQLSCTKRKVDRNAVQELLGQQV